jgi:aspartate/methionine/tyrosine aminotransferase
MPGWRLGYCAGPRPWTDAIGKILGHTTSNAPSLVQYAGLAALRSDGGTVLAMREEFEKRRDFVCRRVEGIEGISAPVPDGAFYLLMDFSAVLPARAGAAKIETCADLALALLENSHVAAVPGAAFGAPGHLRISYAASMEDLEKGLDRIESFLAGLER